MAPVDKTLLLIDAIANLILGSLLLCYPFGVDDLFGLPTTGNDFYPTILGAVIFAIGIALLLSKAGRQGLGIDGAIAINLFGAGVLGLWLVLAPPEIPPRGFITLWAIVVIVLGIGVVELVHRVRSDRAPTGG